MIGMKQKRWIQDPTRNLLYNQLYNVMIDVGNMRDERQISLYNREFIQFPDVFPADIFLDAEVFSKAINITPNEDFLEVGIGSGITSIMAAVQGANVVGVDINKNAVMNSKKNAQINNVVDKTEFFESNLFRNIPSRMFDKIYWNVPFCHSEESNLSLLERSVFDYQYKSLEEFVMTSKSYLKPEGKLLIGFSNTWGLRDKLFKILQQSGYSDINKVEHKMINWNSIPFDLTLYEIRN